jgi:O-antigen ligase
MLALIKDHFSRASLSKFLVLSLLLFLIGFFYFPTAKSHNNFFYLFVLLPGLFFLKDWFVATRHSKILAALSLYILYITASVFWSPDIETSDITTIFKRAIYTFTFLAVLLHVSQASEKVRRDFIITLCLAAMLSALYAMLSDTYSFPETRLHLLGRVESPIRSGCLIGLTALLSLRLVFETEKQVIKALMLTCTLVLVTFVFLTQSRLPIVAMTTAMLVFLFIQLKQHRIFLLVFLTVLAAFIGILVELDYQNLLAQRGLSYRPEIWKDVINTTMQTPILGQGVRSDNNVYILEYPFHHSHSSFVATFRDGGFIGLGLLLAFTGLSALEALKTCKQENGNCAYLVFVIYGVLAISADTDRLLSNPGDFWLFFWFPMLFFMPQRLKP